MNPLFRGTVVARGIVVDPALIGTEEARRRVLALPAWPDLRLLPDGRWLALLAEPAEYRVEQAPGGVLLTHSGGLAPPGLDGEPDRVRWYTDGGIGREPTDGLRAVDAAGWLDLTDFAVVRLHAEPLGRPAPIPVVEPPAAPAPDLRARAGLRAPDLRRRRKLDQEPGVVERAAARAWSGVVRTAIALLLIALAATVVIGVVAAVGKAFGGTPPFVPIAAVFGALCGTALRRSRSPRRRPAAASGAATTARLPGSLRRLLHRAMRRGAAGYLGRRQDRYLRELTQKFARRDWEDGLREAIALNGSGAGGAWLRLRVPRRDSLTLSLGTGGAAGNTVTDDAFAYLQQLYRDAARQLERSDRTDLAVFVLGELLDNAEDAVLLLERRGEYGRAAELAEARALAPETVVRLWWLAGDRDRALRVARTRFAYAAAIDRLDSVDRQLAVELRAAWVAHCQAGADHLAAVVAAWPEPTLRQRVLPDIEAGMTQGGRIAGTLFAHLVTQWPTDAAVDRALALLASGDAELYRSREAFVDTLVGLPPDDRPAVRAADRRLCSAALRAVYGLDPGSDRRSLVNALKPRADPLLAADAAPVPTRRADPWAPLDLVPPLNAGQLPVYDAVTLPGRAVLTAHGDLGVRLHTLDGRVRSRWDVPAHQIVIADNGGVALLVRHIGTLREVTRLDLATRRATRWAGVDHFTFVNTFDGGTLVAVDSDGLAVLDVLATTPRVLSRELDARHRIHALNRTPTRLTALVLVPVDPPGTEPLLQLWSWELPSMTLRVRRTIEVESIRQVAVWADSLVVATADDGEAKLHHLRAFDHEVITPGETGLDVSGDGASLLTQRPLRDTVFCSVDLDDRLGAVHAAFPSGLDTDPARGNVVRVREHDGIVTLFDRAGRVVSADPRRNDVLASFATRA